MLSLDIGLFLGILYAVVVSMLWLYHLCVQLHIVVIGGLISDQGNLVL
jgi:hypothetical protein